MQLRMMGVAMIIVGCGSFGFSIANGYRREVRMLNMLSRIMEDMICQLRYRMTALPELFLLASDGCRGQLHQILALVAQNLQAQSYPDAAGCMESALAAVPGLPESVKRNLQILGEGMGRFDAVGQLSCMESVKQLAMRDLAGLSSGLDGKVRACRTLGLCTGAALAILLI